MRSFLKMETPVALVVIEILSYRQMNHILMYMIELGIKLKWLKLLKSIGKKGIKNKHNSLLLKIYTCLQQKNVKLSFSPTNYLYLYPNVSGLRTNLGYRIHSNYCHHHAQWKKSTGWFFPKLRQWEIFFSGGRNRMGVRGHWSVNYIGTQSFITMIFYLWLKNFVYLILIGWF